MAFTAETIRVLCARGEGAKLDFKRQDYEWTRAASNAELAKDLMAIGNVLGPASSAGFILLGVDNDGTIVGVEPHALMDDAALHQKVGGILNRTPRFTFSTARVDGLVVGVLEITPGGRPYFPLKDAGALRKHVALYRNGSATETASPEMILDWQREDDPVAAETRTLELRKLRAEADVHGHINVLSMSKGPSGAEVDLEIENAGRSGFFIDAIAWRAEWIVGLGTRSFPPGYQAPCGTIEVPRAGIIQPGARVRFSFRWSREQAFAHMQQAGIPIEGFAASWFAYHFEVACHTDLGGEGVLRKVAR